jgi:hypothetical protein
MIAGLGAASLVLGPVPRMPLTPRSWLWTLQLVGGASLLLYPGVLLANLMSLAAPPNPDPGVSDVLVKAFLLGDARVSARMGLGYGACPGDSSVPGGRLSRSR